MQFSAATDSPDSAAFIDVNIAVFLPGDYNNNGTIDAADYTVWRDALETGASSLPSDPTPGSVDETDFLYWRDHFGESLGSGAGRQAGRRARAVEPRAISSWRRWRCSLAEHGGSIH